MNVGIEYNKKADSVYLRFLDDDVAYSKKLDAERTVDYSKEGEIRGINFSCASNGLKTDDLPHRSTIERAMYHEGMGRLLHRNRAAQRLSVDGWVDDRAQPNKSVKSRVATAALYTAAIIIFLGLLAADVLLSRNLFVLTSVFAQVASLCGLIITLFPTVLGSFVLMVIIMDFYSQTNRYKRFETGPSRPYYQID